MGQAFPSPTRSGKMKTNKQGTFIQVEQTPL
jgi:hypothetical protein